jgi:Cytochrome P460
MHQTAKTAAILAICVLGLADAAVPDRDVGAPSAAAAGAGDASPIFGVKIPAGYRQWAMVAVSSETAFDEFRGILGNAVAVKAYANGDLPFPDGTILAKLAWKRVPSSEFSGAFVPGSPTTVQIMVKDSKKYASTGGWGFGRFIGGKPVDEAQHKTCFACHQANVKGHDFVFTRIAP